MSLHLLPPELILIIGTYLPLRDHSALTLTCHLYRTILQPPLLTHLHTLTTTSHPHALLAIYWSSATSNLPKLYHLLTSTPNIAIIDTRFRTHRYHSHHSLITSPGPIQGRNWTWLQTRRTKLTVLDRTPATTRYWHGSGKTAAEHASLIGHRGLLRLAFKDATVAEATHAPVYAALRGSKGGLRIVLEVFRDVFGVEAWERVQKEALEVAVSARGVRFFVGKEGVEGVDGRGRTLLHRAVVGVLNTVDETVGRVSHLEVVRAVLVGGKVGVDARDAEGNTALHLAAKAAFVDVVELLLLGGADVEALDAEGCSALHVALRVEGKPEKWGVVEALRGYGGDLDVKDGKGVVAKELIDGPRQLRSKIKGK